MAETKIGKIRIKESWNGNNPIAVITKADENTEFKTNPIGRRTLSCARCSAMRRSGHPKGIMYRADILGLIY